MKLTRIAGDYLPTTTAVGAILSKKELKEARKSKTNSWMRKTEIQTGEWGGGGGERGGGGSSLEMTIRVCAILWGICQFDLF